MRQAVIPVLLALFYTSSLFASTESTTTDERWYQADIIVFRNETTKNNTGEEWPDARFRPAPANTIQLKTPNRTEDEFMSFSAISGQKGSASHNANLKREPFIELPSSEQLLNDQVALLEKSPNYTILAKMAWRLPVNADEKEQAVLIESPLTSTSTFLLNGSVAISSRRFLHVDVDLWYNELKPEALSSLLMNTHTKNQTINKPLAANAIPLRVAKNFQLKERRRIQKTSEIQYLDSPVIGVLLKLTPYERPEEGLLMEAGRKTNQDSRTI